MPAGYWKGVSGIFENSRCLDARRAGECILKQVMCVMHICMSYYMPDPNRSFEQNIFFEVKRRANEQAVTDLNEYLDLVQEVIVEKVADGVLTEHDNLAQLRADMEHRFSEI